MRGVLAKIDGIDNPFVEFQEGVPQVEVKVNLAAARRYGVKPGDVRRASATLMESEEVGDIFQGGRAYDVHVWSTPETRNSLASVRRLPIDTPDGGEVPLGALADVRIRPTPNVVHHEHLSRSIDVAAGVAGGDLGSVAREVDRRLGKVEFPTGYHAELLGEYQERKAAAKRLFIFGIGAALVIFALLQASFGSWRLATLSFFTLPIALVGGALAAFLFGAHALPRLARRLLHGVRDRRPQRDPHDQPLPAPRAVRGRDLRSRARASRSTGTAGADPDDDAGNRLSRSYRS